MVDYNSVKIDLLSLIPKCELCHQSFDTFLRSPQILPCSHTFCLMCISCKEQRKKRKCGICNEKYSLFRANAAYLVLITSVHLYKQKNDQQSLRCEECGTRQFIDGLRRCVTCEIEIHRMLNHTKQTCCICLECCVDNHNGHDLRRLIRRSNPKEKDDAQTQRKPRDAISQTFSVSHSQGAKGRSDSSSMPAIAASQDSASAPNSCPSTYRLKKGVFKRSELRSESFNNRSKKNVSEPKQPAFSIGTPRSRSQQSFDSSSSCTVICVENPNYVKNVDSGIWSSPSSEEGSSVKKLRASSSTSSNGKALDGHVPNMPRQNPLRGGPNTTESSSEGSRISNFCSYEDEMLPILGRSIRIVGANKLALLEERKKLEQLMNGLRSKRLHGARSVETIPSHMETILERCHSYENVFASSGTCGITESLSCP